ncbi:MULTISPECIES: DUF4276 family protein [Streptomyces]|uniref:DUF4276 family protein n=1 Tax=Streptomyces albus (strain ATCC 21838 / DSM 41398 / FERM P-419 / JCM 4703 / NBRC 107858) TaxID=1081613 RepID=A0A0B5ES65_STRA4|nr:DUF4276 family protein [Streptomyces sp. SCSIO ZS0520]AJE82125.1 hypothetical protein SLNWT_1749 [Streptomyces albus]AOU76440.1 hypothetical protein SLNHY_1749 [Streptomyces albus]AYN32226.1 hypothetical protein DUI70_1723 [Streptomyces albus]
MSRYLTFALFVEGPEDEAFFRPLATRQLQAMAAGLPEPFDVDEWPVTADCSTARSLHEQVCRLVADLATDRDLLLLHNDHRERAKIDKVRSGVELPPGCRIVPTVPIRETEAWLLADGPLLASLPGADRALIPSSPHEAEKVPDPKALLSRILRGRDTRQLAQHLGERADLDRLRRLPAYQQWCADLTAALKELHFL